MDATEIRNLRKALGLTQKQLAGRLQLSVRTVRNWEHGRTVPTAARLLELQQLQCLPASSQTRWTAAAISRLRRRLQLGRTAFAREVGVSYCSVWDWERGKSSPGAETAKRLSRLHGQATQNHGTIRRHWDAARLRRLRLRLGLTQREMAGCLGLSAAGTVSKWECGRSRPGPQSTAKLSRLAEQPGAAPVRIDWSPPRILRLRLRLRIDVKQLAVLAGVNPPAVRHWQRGTHRPGPEAARQLTRLLDLTPGEAFRLLAQLAPPTYGSTVYGYSQYAGDH